MVNVKEFSNDMICGLKRGKTALMRLFTHNDSDLSNDCLSIRTIQTALEPQCLCACYIC